MTIIESFSDGLIESLAKLLGDAGSGNDISRILKACEISDHSGESTKWRRLYWIFTDLQKQSNCANRILDFLKTFLDPKRFVGKTDVFEKNRSDLNNLLVLEGLEFGKDGQFHHQDAAKTLDEADRRVKTIRNKFQGRAIHPEVLRYCKKELMQKNYFHAVFEASKGLAQRIRDMSGFDEDGENLVNKVFSSKNPILAINTLETETEQSEHKGFAALLKGCFGAIRNPLAHKPKILWEGEEDAADYMTLISLLHRKLDKAVLTKTKI